MKLDTEHILWYHTSNPKKHERGVIFLLIRRSTKRVSTFIVLLIFIVAILFSISAGVANRKGQIVNVVVPTTSSAVLIAELEGIRVVFVDTNGSGSNNLHVFKNVLELPLVISSSDNIIQMNYVDSEGKVFAYYVNKQKIVIRTDADHVGHPTATFVVDDDVDINTATVDALDHQCTIYVDRAP